jgi:hypothetical protein
MMGNLDLMIGFKYSPIGYFESYFRKFSDD